MRESPHGIEIMTGFSINPSIFLAACGADCDCGSDGFLQKWLEPALGGWLYARSAWWTLIGFLGGGLFSARFLLQWLTTEKHKRLTVPPIFWHCSFWGSLINTVYFVHLDKAPPILMNIFLPFLYLRNLIYLGRAQQKTLQG